MAKTRPDQLLVERGLAESRTRAQALILAGLVFSGDKRVDKPGQPIAPDAPTPLRHILADGVGSVAQLLCEVRVMPTNQLGERTE